MERAQLLALWNEMWEEGNWIPSWPDSLAGLSAEQAAWKPETGSVSTDDSLRHCIWQEVVHVTFWRRATLTLMAGGPEPTEAEITDGEFALPDVSGEHAWSDAVDALKTTQDAIAAALLSEGDDIARIPFHLIHDAYHLGRVTQLRALQGTAPKF